MSDDNTLVLDRNHKPLAKQRAPIVGDWVQVTEGENVIIRQYHEVPEQELEALPIRIITIRAFRSRLSLAEKVAIKSSNDPIVQVLDDDLKASSFVDLDFAEFVQGVDYLVQANVLIAERKAELLADGTPEEAL